MAIRQADLQVASYRFKSGPGRTLYEAKAFGVRSAFLCHSHHDEALAKGLVTVLGEKGISLYIDWADQTMPPTPNKITAQKIKDKIRESDLFLFLATQNSMTSHWCPWEIGYADGVKQHQAILIIPTSDSSGTHHGNEYLQLYRKIDITSMGELQLYEAANSYGSPVRQL